MSNSTYCTVHEHDRHVLDIIKPNLEHGPWIAGGACIKWFNNNPVMMSDIDVFCKSKNQADALCQKLETHESNIPYSDDLSVLGIKSYSVTPMEHKTDNAVTYTYDTDRGKVRIQIITSRIYNSVDEVLESFDIVACKIATDGNRWVYKETALADIKSKTLRFSKNHFPRTDSIKRLVKYWTYGFNPSQETIDYLTSNVSDKWVFSNDAYEHV